MLRLRRVGNSWEVTSSTTVPGLVLGTITHEDAAMRLETMENLVAALKHWDCAAALELARERGDFDCDQQSLSDIIEYLSML